MKYYKLDSATLEKELSTDIDNGLSTEQVAARFKECGYNSIYSRPSFSFEFFNTIFSFLYLSIPVVHIIFALFDIDNFSDHISDAVVFMFVFLICTLIFSVLRYVVDKGMYLSSLKNSNTLIVVRNGTNVNVKHTEIMYGDIVLLKKGDYIPFDGMIISSNGLVTDESAISGDDRASKHTGVIASDNIRPSQLFNSVFCGTFVVHGKAKVVVTDIASRVYLAKSGKINDYKSNSFSKVIDMSTAFVLVLSLLCIVISIPCGMIAGKYLQILTQILLFSAISVSGFIKLFAEIVYKKAYLNLNLDNILLNSYSDIETLNNSDIAIVDSDLFFEYDSEISSFISENGDFTLASSITKSNFSPFLYVAFCLEHDSSVQKSCCKILKKLGVDFREIDTMCPAFSRSKSVYNSIEICARAYDGNNLLIAVGSVKDIFDITDHRSEADLSKLNSLSTEMIAVAIKNVDVVPEDLFAESYGYKLIGILGINRKVSDDIFKCFSILRKNNIHPIVVFPGNEKAILSAVNNNCRIVPFDAISSECNDNIDYNNIDIICDFDGNYNDLMLKLSENGHLPSYFGEKVLRDRKSLSFRSNEISSYDTRDADIVAPKKLHSMFKALIESKKSVDLLNRVLENFALFSAFYTVVGLLTSVFYGDMLMPTSMTAFILLIVLPADFFVSLYKMKYTNLVAYTSFKKRRLFLIISALLFVVVGFLSKFIVTNPAYVSFEILFFITFLCADVDVSVRMSLLNTVCLVIPIIISIVLISPLAVFLGIESIGIVGALLSVLIGFVAKLIANYICRSVNS